MSATKKTDIEPLVPAAQSGSSEAINALVHAMRPTVEMIAMKYIHSPLEKDDLVQEGMIGLLAPCVPTARNGAPLFALLPALVLKMQYRPLCENSAGEKMFRQTIWSLWMTIWTTPVQPSVRRTIFWLRRV